MARLQRSTTVMQSAILADTLSDSRPVLRRRMPFCGSTRATSGAGLTRRLDRGARRMLGRATACRLPLEIVASKRTFSRNHLDLFSSCGGWRPCTEEMAACAKTSAHRHYERRRRTRVFMRLMATPLHNRLAGRWVEPTQGARHAARRAPSATRERAPPAVPASALPSPAAWRPRLAPDADSATLALWFRRQVVGWSRSRFAV